MKATRDQVVKVPMTASEKRDVRKKAKANRSSVAAYLRRLAEGDLLVFDDERAARIRALGAELLRLGPRTEGRLDLRAERKREGWGERRDLEDP